MGTDTTTVAPQARSALLCTLLLSLPLAAPAAQWQADASVTVSAEYTDNQNKSEDNPNSAYIGELSPSIGLSARGDRLYLQGSYRYAYRLNSASADRGHHQLNLQAELEPIDDQLTLFARTFIRRQIADLNLLLLPTDPNDEALETVQTYSAGLDWELPLARMADSTLSLLYRLAKTSESIDEASGYQFDYAIRSGPWFDRTFWDLAYRLSREQTDDQPTDQFQYATANAGIGLFGDISAVANGYWEENEAITDTGEIIPLESASAGPGLRWTPSPRTTLQVTYNMDLKQPQGREKDDYWAFFGRWQPTIRTEMEAEYGQRFYGDYYRAAFSHSTRKLRNRLSYNESLSTFSREVSGSALVGLLVCPIGETPSIDQCSLLDLQNPVVPPGMQLIGLEVPFSRIGSAPYISRRAQWFSSFVSGKQIWDLNLFYGEREFVVDSIQEQDYGGRLSWALNIGPRTGLQLSYTRRWLQQEDQDDTDNDTRYNLTLTRQLSRQLSSSLALIRTERDSDTNPYDENRVTLSFTFSL